MGRPAALRLQKTSLKEGENVSLEFSLDREAYVYLFDIYEDGKAAVLEDRCPHRFAPLSMGKVAEHGLQCTYHGLQFNGRGQCTHNPFGNQPPARARANSAPSPEYRSACSPLSDPCGSDGVCEMDDRPKMNAM